MTQIICAALLLLAFGPAAMCQQQNPQPRPTQPGTLTGQVLCADTQRPARLADVELVRVPGAADMPKSAGGHTQDTAAPVTQTGATSLDGSYTIAGVKPGRYYVVVDAPGYLIPLAAFGLKDLAAPDTATRVRLDRQVQTINVNPGETVKKDVVLERGASLSGIVIYDDGSPASGIAIEVLSRDKTGKWMPSMDLHRYRSGFGGFSDTNDEGSFRITGLPPGEYALQANFSLNTQEMSSGPMPGKPKVTINFAISTTVFSLPLYSGSVLRKSDAKAWKLHAGEAEDGISLVFPISKLHRVTGHVLARDGHAMNGGTVKVLYADDQTQLTEAPILFDGSGFHLDFVPEGQYVLKVEGGKDVTHIEVANSAGYTPAVREDSKTLQTYPDFQQPLVVTGDLSNFVASQPDASTTNTAPAATQ